MDKRCKNLFFATTTKPSFFNIFIYWSCSNCCWHFVFNYLIKSCFNRVIQHGRFLQVAEWACCKSSDSSESEAFNRSAHITPHGWKSPSRASHKQSPNPYRRISVITQLEKKINKSKFPRISPEARVFNTFQEYLLFTTVVRDLDEVGKFGPAHA